MKEPAKKLKRRLGSIQALVPRPPDIAALAPIALAFFVSACGQMAALTVNSSAVSSASTTVGGSPSGSTNPSPALTPLPTPTPTPSPTLTPTPLPTPNPAALTPTPAPAPAPAGAGSGTAYYVSPNGSDANNGLSTGSAFQTIAHAAGLTQPGDVVNVTAGTYGSFYVFNSGSASAYIVYQGYPKGTRPVIQESASDDQGIQVLANYVVVAGFEVIGDARSITQAQANNENLNDPALNDTGIVAGQYGSNTIYHHIIVSNNIVHDVDEDGIAIGNADYVTIQGNVVYGNSNWSGYAGSGISAFPRDIDANTGYKTYIIGNIVYDNVELVINTGNGPGLGITDGEGIIVDSAASLNNYGGRTLIANNITYHNGAQGILAFASNHVDIVNNTCYEDDTNLTDRGEITANEAEDVTAYNNILYAAPGTGASGGFAAADYNDYFNVAPQTLGAHDIQSDPLFIGAAALNFLLQAASPAFGAGTPSLAPATDILGKARPAGTIALGAYQ
jgi:parallel beta-helix repeat protein